MEKKRLQVAVGILVDPSGELLIQQRRAGTDCAGQWEFPGGKLEAGETAEQALTRELLEELNIVISEPAFLTCLEHNYDHAHVTLHTYLIHKWQGEPEGREGQAIVWGPPQILSEYDLLEAAYPLLECAIARIHGH